MDTILEQHPLAPFLPDGAQILMLGSFPPPHARWSMEFYYPNFSNDMWRIMGIIFYGDRDHFADTAHRRFRCDEVVEFCRRHGIALYDTATEVRRAKGNAADKFLEVVTPTDIGALIDRLPQCRAIVTTGEKAAATIADTLGCAVPSAGTFTEFSLPDARRLRLYRLPSSSRAYPLALDRKAAAYRAMFLAEGMLK